MEDMNTGITYRYLADGTKESTVDNEGNGFLYRGNFVYRQTKHQWDWGGGIDSALSSEPESVAWKEGRVRIVSALDSLAVDPIVVDGLETGIVMANWEEPVDSIEFINPYSYIDEWHIKDHLGSVRAVAVTNGDSSAGNNGVVELNDYLPFGTRITTGLVSEVNRYGFASKERQSIGAFETGHLDFGARHYDPFTARWTTTDPLAGKYHSFSPYNYCAGNPVNLVDPEGMSWYYSAIDGSFVSHIEDDDDRVYLLSHEQIGSANGDQKLLQSYRTDENMFGQLGLEGKLNTDIAKAVISDFFDRANKKTEDGQETYITKPEIAPFHDFTKEEASSTSAIINVNLASSAYFNGYDIVNLLSHEIGHTLHRHQVGEKVFKDLPDGAKELKADEFSISHWSYEKTSQTRIDRINKHKDQYR